MPHPLPSKLDWDDAQVSLVSSADLALGILSGLGETLPNPHLLIYPFSRREAVLSSRIEGTQSSLSDLLLLEATQVEKQRDVKEVHLLSFYYPFNLKPAPTARNLSEILNLQSLLW